MSDFNERRICIGNSDFNQEKISLSKSDFNERRFLLVSVISTKKNFF